MRFNLHKMNLALGLLIFLFPTSSYASEIKSDKKIGVGLGIGSTSALTAKYYLGPDKALQVFFGAGGYLDGSIYSVGEIDYLIETKIQDQDFGEIFWGYGAGAKFYSYGSGLSNALGLVLILEAGVHLDEKPLEVVLDIRPDLSLSSSLLFSYTYGGSLRYYF